MARNLHLTLLYIFKYTNSYSILTLIFKQRSDSQSLVYSKPNWLRQIVVSLSVVEVGVFVWRIVSKLLVWWYETHVWFPSVIMSDKKTRSSFSCRSRSNEIKASEVSIKEWDTSSSLSFITFILGCNENRQTLVL